jgi:2-dehydro-3-deoxyphosphogluconate aldolase / (4S)-4-hydroxy-2-oxoglutarate aldolase
LDKARTFAKVHDIRLLAVIRGPSPELTIRMVDALVEGGVVGIEITYSTPQAAWVVNSLAEKYGDDILLGMGTLVDVRQVTEAQQAGARFIVSPHYEASLAEAMVRSGLLTMVGALTPTEVMQAHRTGSDIIKLFPGSLVGPAYLRALRGPFPKIPMMPTGGVSPDNIVEWFAAGAVAVGAGGNLCPTAWAEADRFSAITANAREFVKAVAKASGSR